MAKMILPDWMRVRIITPDCSNDSSWLLPLPDSDLIVALRKNWSFVDVVNEDGDGGGGGWTVPAPNQSYRVLSTEYQNVLILPLEVQHLVQNTVN